MAQWRAEEGRAVKERRWMGRGIVVDGGGKWESGDWLSVQDNVHFVLGIYILL